MMLVELSYIHKFVIGLLVYGFYLYLFIESHKWQNMRTGVQRKLMSDFNIIFLCFDFRFKFNVFVFIKLSRVWCLVHE